MRSARAREGLDRGAAARPSRAAADALGSATRLGDRVEVVDMNDRTLAGAENRDEGETVDPPRSRPLVEFSGGPRAVDNNDPRQFSRVVPGADVSAGQHGRLQVVVPRRHRKCEIAEQKEGGVWNILRRPIGVERFSYCPGVS